MRDSAVVVGDEWLRLLITFIIGHRLAAPHLGGATPPFSTHTQLRFSITMYNTRPGPPIRGPQGGRIFSLAIIQRTCYLWKTLHLVVAVLGGPRLSSCAGCRRDHIISIMRHIHWPTSTGRGKWLGKNGNTIEISQAAREENVIIMDRGITIVEFWRRVSPLCLLLWWWWWCRWWWWW